MQREIKKPTLLLSEKGNVLKPGYAKQMIYRYNRHRVSGRSFGLKEWDFYQMNIGNWVLQMVIGHVSYMASFSATLFSLQTGERHHFTQMKPLPLRGLHMPLSPDVPHRIKQEGKHYCMQFRVTDSQRHLILRAQTKEGLVDIDLTLPQNKQDEKMVIATPFEKEGQFYLNCKQHFYGVEGYAQFGNTKVWADGTQTGLIDWGRGVWPFHQEWFWGCGSGFVGENRFGFNIGWGFGNTSAATENMFFWNGKGHKLGQLLVERNEKDYMAPWHFKDEDGCLDMVMTPTFNNYTETKLAFVNNHCNQVFGLFDGWAKLPDGSKIQIENLLAFCEHAVNNW